MLAGIRRSRCERLLLVLNASDRTPGYEVSDYSLLGIREELERVVHGTSVVLPHAQDLLSLSDTKLILIALLWIELTYCMRAKWFQTIMKGTSAREDTCYRQFFFLNQPRFCPLLSYMEKNASACSEDILNFWGKQWCERCRRVTESIFFGHTGQPKHFLLKMYNRAAQEKNILLGFCGEREISLIPLFNQREWACRALDRSGTRRVRRGRLHVGKLAWSYPRY